MNSVDETKFPTKILSKADKEIKLPLVLETQMMKSFGFFARYYGIVYFVMLCFFFVPLSGGTSGKGWWK